jgi:predicted metal-dependent hydrolase
MKFDFEDGFDRYWAGSPFRSLFWSQLSTAFQPGERFFIDSARALRSCVDDPRLLAEVDQFCRQEGHHTAQHLKFDRMNQELGIDVPRCRARYTRMLGLARNYASPKRMLGITCALEHFTSSFADLLFRRPDIAEGSDPRVAALWAWHAIEEAEHRASCYDVYVAAGGAYPTRVLTLLSSWTFILSISLANTFTLLRQERRVLTWDTVKGLGYLFGTRGVVTSLLPEFFRYLRPGFHPWDHATVDGETIRRWQECNARYIQNLPGVEATPPATRA